MRVSAFVDERNNTVCDKKLIYITFFRFKFYCVPEAKKIVSYVSHVRGPTSRNHADFVQGAMDSSLMLPGR